MTETGEVQLFAELASEATSRYIVQARQRADAGGQLRYRFPNGLGASVIRYAWYRDGKFSVGTYGYEDNLFELAVLRWPEAGGTEDGEVDYNFPLTVNDGGVVGWLTGQRVEELLLAIKRTPAEKP